MPNHGTVTVIYNSKAANIYARTLSYHLPHLWTAHTINDPGSATLETKLYLPPNYGRLRRQRKALHDVFEHLREMDQGTGKSARLLQSLESTWNSSYHGTHMTRDAFYTLGCLLSHQQFGCSREIWSAMESFLTRHCGGIMASPPGYWITYVEALEHMVCSPDMDMTNVLACIIRCRKLSYDEIRYLKTYGAVGPITYQYFQTLYNHQKSRQRQARLNFARHGMVEEARHRNRVTDTCPTRCYDRGPDPRAWCERCRRNYVNRRGERGMSQPPEHLLHCESVRRRLRSEDGMSYDVPRAFDRLRLDEGKHRNHGNGFGRQRAIEDREYVPRFLRPGREESARGRERYRPGVGVFT